MAKAVYWQRGESLDYVNVGTTKIEANSVIELSDRIGVAGTDIAPNEKGSVHVTGVFQFPKTGTADIAMGATVYWDGTGITDTASGNTEVGYAAQAAAAADTTVYVKLKG